MEEIRKIKNMLPDMGPAETADLMRKLLDLSEDVYRQYEDRNREAASCICEIPISQIDPFPDHPFYVNDDEDMMDLAGSIAANGMLVPVSVRRKPDGRYQMLSGHRRMRACRIAGINTIRCEVLSLDDAKAAVFVVESNRQRAKIFPGEKAFAFQLRHDAGVEYINEGFSKDVGSFDRIEKTPNDREQQVQKCIRLTELIPELMEMVDRGKMGIRPAMELACLSRLKQGWAWQAMELEESTPVHTQVIRMRELEARHELTEEKIGEIIREPKANQMPKLTFTESQLEGCIPEDIPADKRREYVINVLKNSRRAGSANV